MAKKFKAHEAIYDIMFEQPDRWFDVRSMEAESSFAESTVRRALHHLDAAQLVDQRQFSGRTQYSLAFIPLPVAPKRGWRRFLKK